MDAELLQKQRDQLAVKQQKVRPLSPGEIPITTDITTSPTPPTSTSPSRALSPVDLGEIDICHFDMTNSSSTQVDDLLATTTPQLQENDTDVEEISFNLQQDHQHRSPVKVTMWIAEDTF